MEFTIEQQLRGEPAAVEGILLDPEFIVARAALPKLGDAELLESTHNGDEARQRIRLRFTAPLAPAVTAVIDPNRLTWIDDATYDLSAHTAEHRVVPDHYADRLSCSYRTVIEATPDGSRRSMAGTIKVRMPLVGGKVERAIVSGLTEHAVAEADLVNEWLARRQD
ncbi:MAG: DUF2505 family protein [Acidimicrobiia bacterium]